MAATRLSNADVTAMCDALVDRLDLGTGAAVIKVYSGSQPADADATVGGATLLAQLTCSATAFGAASNGVATANSVTDDTSANATGTAAWFRAETSGGTAIIDGDVGTGTSADMQLNSTSITAGATVSVTSWTVTMPKT